MAVTPGAECACAVEVTREATTTTQRHERNETWAIAICISRTAPACECSHERRPRRNVAPSVVTRHTGHSNARAFRNLDSVPRMRLREFQQLIDETYGEKDRARGLASTFLWF